MNMNTVVLVGRSCSGKTFLKKYLQSRGCRTAVTWTTRPRRPEEVDGVDYRFVTKDAFDRMDSGGRFAETVEYGGHRYGSLNSDWEAGGLFVLDPSGVASLSADVRARCLVVFLDVSEEELVRRAGGEGTDRRTTKRIEEDRAKFAGFEDWDIRLESLELSAKFLR